MTEPPNHITIGRRISKLSFRTEMSLILSPEPIEIAVDSPGVKVTDRGDWLRRKHGVERRSWLKLHVAVDTCGSGLEHGSD